MSKQKEWPELSRPLSVDKVPAGGMIEHIVASPAERKALATRFGLPDIARLEATLNIDHAQGKMIVVAGTFDVELQQTCVVSLEPFPVHLIDKIDVLFAHPAFFKEMTHDNHDLSGIEDEPDGPEPIIDGSIDLGELVAQHISLELDPYPRKPGVSFGQAEIAAAPAKTNPFANLASILDKGKKDGPEGR